MPSPPLNEFTLDASWEGCAQISGRGAAASQHSSPIYTDVGEHPRDTVPAVGPPRGLGEFPLEPTRMRMRPRSNARSDSLPGTALSPHVQPTTPVISTSRTWFPQQLRVRSRTPGFPQPESSSICVMKAPTPQPSFRITKYRDGSRGNVVNCNPTLAMEGSECTRCLRRERREAIGASFQPYAGELNSEKRHALEGSHSGGARQRTSLVKPSAC